jgi:hypothetical protein
MKAKKPEPFRSWDEVPLTVTIDDAVRITRKSASTIYREVERSAFYPRPLPRIGKTTPLCWSKDAFVAEYGGEYLARQQRDQQRRGRCFSGPRRMPVAS